jgi:hypothetical protein
MSFKKYLQIIQESSAYFETNYYGDGPIEKEYIEDFLDFLVEQVRVKTDDIRKEYNQNKDPQLLYKNIGLTQDELNVFIRNYFLRHTTAKDRQQTTKISVKRDLKKLPFDFRKNIENLSDLKKEDKSKAKRVISNFRKTVIEKNIEEAFNLTINNIGLNAMSQKTDEAKKAIIKDKLTSFSSTILKDLNSNYGKFFNDFIEKNKNKEDAKSVVKLAKEGLTIIENVSNLFSEKIKQILPKAIERINSGQTIDGDVNSTHTILYGVLYEINKLYNTENLIYDYLLNIGKAFDSTNRKSMKPADSKLVNLLETINNFNSTNFKRLQK